MCFVFIWEQTATCATYSINWLVFITEMKSVYSAGQVLIALKGKTCVSGRQTDFSQCVFVHHKSHIYLLIVPDLTQSARPLPTCSIRHPTARTAFHRLSRCLLTDIRAAVSKCNVTFYRPSLPFILHYHSICSNISNCHRIQDFSPTFTIYTNPCYAVRICWFTYIFVNLSDALRPAAG